VTSGRMVPGTLPAESLEFLKDSLEIVLRYGEAHGVRIGMEYEPGLLVERWEELASLLDAVDSPWFGANLDLGHSHVLGEDPELVIGSLGTRIFHVHMEDIARRKHYHLVPGLGEVDFRELFRTLAENRYDGFITVELYTYPHQPGAAAAQSLAHLQQFIHPVPQVEP
jgi:fructoselysine 3-epimerase